MHKMLLQMVAEMRRLGATVVAADFSSVILATGKHSLSAAVGCACCASDMAISLTCS